MLLWGPNGESERIQILHQFFSAPGLSSFVEKKILGLNANLQKNKNPKKVGFSLEVPNGKK